MQLLKRPARFGLYHVCSGTFRYTTPSKVEAIEVCERVNGHIHFDFNDSIYGAKNWQDEPKQSLKELYAQRARQIRQQYDQVVVAYSGGFDSHNQLMCFLENGLHVDLVVTWYHSRDPDPMSATNHEMRVQTMPMIRKVQETYPWVKWQAFDISDIVIEQMDRFYDDWVYLSPGGQICPNKITVQDWLKLLPLNADKTTGVVMGVDKPRMRYHQGRWIYNFYDVPGFARPIHDDGDNIVWFYWDPACPDLVIKQAHEVRRYWMGRDFQTHPTNHHNPDLGIVLDQNDAGVQRLIYPYCEQNHLKWAVPDQIIGTLDEWMFKSNTDYGTKLRNLYQSIATGIPSHRFNADTPSKGLILNISQDYVIEQG